MNKGYAKNTQRKAIRMLSETAWFPRSSSPATLVKVNNCIWA